MKIAICAAIVVAVLAATALAQTPTAAMPAKHSETTGEPTYEGRIEGDTIEECWIIPSLPFTGTDNTCGFANDYDEVCPYGGSWAPDVVYGYLPPHDMCVSISLCDSYYDTKVYVYEDEWTPGFPLACNDDDYDCVDPPVQYTSWIPSVQLLAGHTYYIVIDGYYGECGDYVLEMTEVDCPVPCDVVCSGIPEGEPVCYDGYEDHYNGGCNSDPSIFSIVFSSPDPITYCGESGVYEHSNGATYRDTDWYMFSVWGEPVPFSITVEAEFGVLFGFVDGLCDNPSFVSYSTTLECTPHTITEELPYGTYAVFVSTDSWDPEYECGIEYSLTIEGYSPFVPADALSWGRVKSLYR